MRTRTQVGIVGAGPAGLMLGQLLQRAGIESVTLERSTRAEVEAIVRAGVLEQGTADLLNEIGAGQRMSAVGALHRGIVLRFDGRDHRIDFPSLAGGRCVTVYPQHDVNRDLIDVRFASGGDLRFGARVTALEGIDAASPVIRFVDGKGIEGELDCDFVAGTDGTHSVCRLAIAPGAVKVHERDYPFGWLGILCEAPRSTEELIYCRHDRGFALVSTRSPQLQRMYLQCAPDESLEAWSDERIWAEFHARLATRDGWTLKEGRIVGRNVIAMRSRVTEPMSRGRLYLAGDAAHIVPPTGAKGLNLAAFDARLLARALAAHYHDRRDELLQSYSEQALRRVWKVTRFSWWMTSLLHRAPGADAFEQRMQLAELDYLAGSRAASAALAENYVGLPFDAES